MISSQRSIVSRRNRLGEGPLWNAVEQRLYWVDIDDGFLFRCKADGSGCETVLSAGPIGGFTIQYDGRLVLLMEGGAIRLFENGILRSWKLWRQEFVGSRWNDALADEFGRIYSGSIEGRGVEGVLCRIEKDGSVRKLRGMVGCSNGMGFSPDGMSFYHTDSFARVIRRYAYHRESGSLSEETIFASFPPEQGMPDGLAIDADGCVWSAFWDGGCVRRLAPDGRELLKIDFPASRVTSLTFGGPDFTDIFITTAGGDDPAHFGSGAGNLFHLNLGIKGRATYPSRLNLPPPLERL